MNFVSGLIFNNGFPGFCFSSALADAEVTPMEMRKVWLGGRHAELIIWILERYLRTNNRITSIYVTARVLCIKSKRVERKSGTRLRRSCLGSVRFRIRSYKDKGVDGTEDNSPGQMGNFHPLRETAGAQ